MPRQQKTKETPAVAFHKTEAQAAPVEDAPHPELAALLQQPAKVIDPNAHLSPIAHLIGQLVRVRRNRKTNRWRLKAVNLNPVEVDSLTLVSVIFQVKVEPKNENYASSCGNSEYVGYAQGILVAGDTQGGQRATGTLAFSGGNACFYRKGGSDNYPIEACAQLQLLPEGTNKYWL